jgi:hypothetical protein
MQVLASLQLLDYIIVAFLPGISEVISKENYVRLICVYVCVFGSFSIIVLLRLYSYMPRLSRNCFFVAHCYHFLDSI